MTDGCAALNSITDVVLDYEPEAKKEKLHAVLTPATYQIYNADAFAWLAARDENSLHAIVTDPPYGVKEYTEDEQTKLRAGRGGVWRIPPSFDGSKGMALAASGCDQAHVHHRPRLLSDNGPCYIAGELAEYIETQRMSHVRGAPFHPQTQGKIERWHQSLKNRISQENYFLPGDLEAQIEAFVDHYNHQRYHESLSNVTPADAYFGRAATIIKQRERIKRQTIEHRRPSTSLRRALQHRKLAA